jgi:hypothetical protein
LVTVALLCPALDREARARTVRGLPKSSFPPQDGVIARLNGLTMLANCLVSYWPLAREWGTKKSG